MEAVCTPATSRHNEHGIHVHRRPLATSVCPLLPPPANPRRLRPNNAHQLGQLCTCLLLTTLWFARHLKSQCKEACQVTHVRPLYMVNVASRPTTKIAAGMAPGFTKGGCCPCLG